MDSEIIEYIRINAEQKWAKQIKSMYMDDMGGLKNSSLKIQAYYELYEKYKEIELFENLLDDTVLVKFPIHSVDGHEIQILDDDMLYISDIEKEIKTYIDNIFFKNNLSFTNSYNRSNNHNNFKLGMYRRSNLYSRKKWQ